MAKLAVDIDDIVLARSDASHSTEHYIDTETGKVVALSEELLSFEYNEMSEHIDSEEMDINEVREVIDEHVDHAWKVSSFLQQYQIRNDSEDRYVHIPFEGSRKAYRDMHNFKATVEDEHLRERLEVAIDGEGAFRRFKNVLSEHPEERQRWFEFSEKRKRRRARKWLEVMGLNVADKGEGSEE
jgi:hypothetical protein